MTIRVLTFLHSLNRGGIEVTLLRCLPYLQASGITLDIACSGPPAALDATFLGQGCRILRFRRSANPWFTAGSVQRILRGGNYDLVHSRFGYTSGGISYAAHRAGVPSLVSLHSTAPSRFDLSQTRGFRHAHRAWIRLHRALIDRYASAVIGHSKANLDAFEPQWRFQSERYHCVYNGVPLPELPTREAARASLRCPPDTRVLLHVGSMRPQKNHAGLLRIFAQVHQRCRQTSLWMVGDGSSRHSIEEELNTLGIANVCTLWGVKSDPWPFYRAADLFVFPSVHEGFGNVLIEAQNAGLPVAASNIRPLVESVAPCYHPWMFDPADTMAGARAVLEILQSQGSPEARARRASASAFAAAFSVEAMADRLTALFRQYARPRRG